MLMFSKRSSRTIAVYKNALRLPLLFLLNLDIDVPLMFHFMRGLWGLITPPKIVRMPAWDLNLLAWFQSKEFWPPTECNFQ